MIFAFQPGCAAVERKRTPGGIWTSTFLVEAFASSVGTRTLMTVKPAGREGVRVDRDVRVGDGRRECEGRGAERRDEARADGRAVHECGSFIGWEGWS